MRKKTGFVLAAALFLALPGMAQAQLLKSYGKLGAWSVTLAKDPTGDEICVVSSRQPPNGPAGFNLSFVVDSNYTRLFLGYQGPAMPTPDAVALAVGGSALANLLVTAPRRDFGNDLHLIMIDLPTGLLQKVIFPAMGDDHAITARAGEAAFSVSTGHFDQVISLVDNCSRQERKDDDGS
jgi:hypothetical protein